MTALGSIADLTTARAAAPTTTRSSAVFGLRITFGGLLFGMVSVLIAVAALNSEANLLLLLSGMGAGAMLLNAVLPIITLRRVEVDRIMPEGVVAGRPFTIAYRVRSRRRWLRIWSLTVTEVPVDERVVRFPHLYIPVLLPRQEQRLELIGNCPRRTRLALQGVRIASRFPFGLFTCHVDLALPEWLTVYPAIGRLRRDPWRASRAAQSLAARKTREQENPEEFVGVREYREGDNYRWIHWRRSAHTGELVVREMIPLRQTRLIVMLDPWPENSQQARRPSPGSEPDLTAERLISAAATAICAGLDQGHRVGLICRAALPLVVAPTSGRVHRQRMLRELATISPPADIPFDELAAGVHWSAGWNARCMILTARLDQQHQRVARVIGPRAEAILVLVPGTDAFDSVFDTAGTEPAGRRTR
jgi:uncharacterized protein (DUF58 family)